MSFWAMFREPHLGHIPKVNTFFTLYKRALYE